MSDSAPLNAFKVSVRELGAMTVPARVFLAVVLAAAVALPFVLQGLTVRESVHAQPLTAAVLVGFSIVNVEISRALAGGLSRTQQPHKALSAWTFASALLLPAPWLLVIVPSTYVHARWRGLRVPLWKWVGSAAFLILCGVLASVVAHAVFGHAHWTRGDGGRGLWGVVAATAAFLALESGLFARYRMAQPRLGRKSGCAERFAVRPST